MARPYVAHVNIADIEPFSRAPGRAAYMLSRDPDTTARTAVQRVTPTAEFKAEPMAHFHKTTEEILVLEGLMSFDSRTWLPPGSYVFHPREYVHGFASALPVETLYISRVGAELDFTYVPDPLSQDCYFVGESPSARKLVYAPSAIGGEWETLPAQTNGRHPNWLKVLSQDTENGQGSALIRLSAGGRIEGLTTGFERELFVVEGVAEAQDGARFSRYSYACWPAGQAQPGFETPTGALLYLYCDKDLSGVLTKLGLRP